MVVLPMPVSMPMGSFFFLLLTVYIIRALGLGLRLLGPREGWWWWWHL